MSGQLRHVTRTIAAGAAVCAALAAAGCATSGSQVAPGSGSSSAATPAASVRGQPSWRGSLTAQNGSGVTGTASVRPISDAETQATLTVAGAPAGTVHPWHIHTGTCAQTGGIVGPPTAYTAISISGDGTGTVVVTLPFATPTSGTYSVNVHESPSNLGTIIACADLGAM